VAHWAVVAEPGFLVEVKPQAHGALPRTGQVIELYRQWFVAMNKVSAKDPANGTIAKADAVDGKWSPSCQTVGQHLMDEQHPGLVYFTPAVVGPQIRPGTTGRHGVRG
jgi:hypothetical protein